MSYRPSEFYPANIRNGGKPGLFTNSFENPNDAKQAVQKLIDSDSFGTANHVIGGYAFFDKDNNIVYVFTTKEEVEKTLKSIKRLVTSGSTPKYAKLKMLKKSTIWAFNFLNRKDLVCKVSKANTFKDLNSILQIL